MRIIEIYRKNFIYYSSLFLFLAYFFHLEVRAGKDFQSKMGSDILGPRIGSS